jgi:hypothetical protein
VSDYSANENSDPNYEEGQIAAPMEFFSPTLGGDLDHTYSLEPPSNVEISLEPMNPLYYGLSTNSYGGEYHSWNCPYPLDQASNDVGQNFYPESTEDDDQCTNEVSYSQSSNEGEMAVEDFNDYNPSTSKRTRKPKHNWTKREDSTLMRLCQMEPSMGKGKRVWPKITKKLNNECGLNLTSKQCREHYARITSGHNKSTWTAEENYYLNQYKDGLITEEQLMAKVKRSKKQIKERLETITKRNGQFSKEETQMLQKLIKLYGYNPSLLAREMRKRSMPRSSQQIQSQILTLQNNAGN